jgi:hypothetical protein
VLALWSSLPSSLYEQGAKDFCESIAAKGEADIQ